MFLIGPIYLYFSFQGLKRSDKQASKVKKFLIPQGIIIYKFNLATTKLHSHCFEEITFHNQSIFRAVELKMFVEH